MELGRTYPASHPDPSRFERWRMRRKGCVWGQIDAVIRTEVHDGWTDTLSEIRKGWLKIASR